MTSENKLNSTLVDIIDYCTCPISKQIYYDPVIAEDGNVYEKEAIQEWFEGNNKKYKEIYENYKKSKEEDDEEDIKKYKLKLAQCTVESPITKNEISCLLVKDLNIKNISKIIVKNFPDYKNIRFISKKRYDYGYNKDTIRTILNSVNGNKKSLLKYNNFDLNELVNVSGLFDLDLDILEHVLKNIIHNFSTTNNIDTIHKELVKKNKEEMDNLFIKYGFINNRDFHKEYFYNKEIIRNIFLQNDNVELLLCYNKYHIHDLLTSGEANKNYIFISKYDTRAYVNFNYGYYNCGGYLFPSKYNHIERFCNLPMHIIIYIIDKNECTNYSSTKKASMIECITYAFIDCNNDDKLADFLINALPIMKQPCNSPTWHNLYMPYILLCEKMFKSYKVFVESIEQIRSSNVTTKYNGKNIIEHILENKLISELELIDKEVFIKNNIKCPYTVILEMTDIETLITVSTYKNMQTFSIEQVIDNIKNNRLIHEDNYVTILDKIHNPSNSFQYTLLFHIVSNFNTEAYIFRDDVLTQLFIDGIRKHKLSYSCFINILECAKFTNLIFNELFELYPDYLIKCDDNNMLPLYHINNISNKIVNLYADLIPKMDRDIIICNITLFLKYCDYNRLSDILCKCKDKLVDLEGVCEKIYLNENLTQKEKFNLIKMVI